MLYLLLPNIRAILNNKPLLNAENLDLIDYLIEGDYLVFQSDLLIFKYLNKSNPEEREQYITKHYGSYFQLKDLGIFATIGDNNSYVVVAYDWNKNMAYLYHTEIGTLSDAYYLETLIEIIQHWLHYADTGFLPEPNVDKNTTAGLEKLIDFYQHHDQNNPQVQEKIISFTKKKNNLYSITTALPTRITALQTLTKSRPLLAREQLEVDILQSILAARDIAEIDALLAKISNTPTDAELRKRLLTQAEAKRELILDNNV